MKQAETNVGRKKETIKQNNKARNWDVGIPQLNHPTYISIYIDVRRRRKTERLPLESKTEAETVNRKMKPCESKGGEGEETKPETMNKL